MPDPLPKRQPERAPSTAVEQRDFASEILGLTVETSVERESTPEQAKESAPANEQISEAVVAAQQIAPEEPIVHAVPVDPVTAEIESILEEDLTDAFLSMTPEQQEVFAQKGEETLGKIRQLIGHAEKAAEKIFGLIRDWLSLIPGMNRFFLEQEAKIKTDKLVTLSQEELKRGQHEL